MAVMGQTWSDDRLDELSLRVQNGFAQVDRRFERMGQRFDAFEERCDERSAEANRRLEQVEHRIETLEERHYALHKLMLQASIGMMVTVIVASSGVIASLN